MEKETAIEFDNHQTLSFLSNTLCRYRAINPSNLDALRNNQLYFSIPGKSFNDPFDNLIYANPREILRRIYKDIDLNMDDYLEQQKDKTFSFATIGSIKYHGPHRKKIMLDFLEECEAKIKLFKDKLVNNTRIICFSELYDSMLMWSHYADQHKGFAIIYDKESIEQAVAYNSDYCPIIKNPLLLPVKYVSKQVDLTDDLEIHLRNYFVDYFRRKMPKELGDNIIGLTPSDKDLSQTRLRQSIIEKSIDWEYEKEWRLIPRHISLERQSTLYYIKIVPKGVIIGAKCSEEDSNTLLDICKQNGIPLFDIRVKEWEPGFKLHVSAYKHQ